MVHLYAVENHLMQVDVVMMVAQQNLDVLNQDVVLTFLNAVHLEHLVRQLDVVVDAELRHQLKMDCYQDVVGVELLRQLKMDCYQDVVLLVWQVHQKMKTLVFLQKYLREVAQSFLRAML